MTKRATGAAQSAAPAPRKSGSNIPDSQRHTVKLQLRVAPEIVARLDTLRGMKARSTAVADLIRAMAVSPP